MVRKQTKRQKAMKLLHKFARFTKHQRIFVLYLVVLSAFLFFFPLIKILPVDAKGAEHIFLLSGNFFKTMLIIFVSLAILWGWNMSFKFKNIIINYFGFKENSSLFNFGLLWVITTAYLSIGDVINVVGEVTSTIKPTFWYYIVELLLILGLILTLVSVLKKAKDGTKTKIINIVDEDANKDLKHSRDSIKGLFDKGDDEA